MSYRSDSGSDFFAAVIVLVIVLIGAGIFGAVKASTAYTETVTVQEKERVCDGGKDGSCRYLVFTDKGVFENTDSWFAGKWNSSDFQGQLKIGKKYEVEARGWRIPFLSQYPNITAIKKEIK